MRLLKMFPAYVGLVSCLAAQCKQSYVSGTDVNSLWSTFMSNLCLLQSCLGLIRSMQDRAYSMFDAGAYLHQYQQFGIDRQDFEGCFARVEDIYASYKAL